MVRGSGGKSVGEGLVLLNPMSKVVKLLPQVDDIVLATVLRLRSYSSLSERQRDRRRKRHIL